MSQLLLGCDHTCSQSILLLLGLILPPLRLAACDEEELDSRCPVQTTPSVPNNRLYCSAQVAAVAICRPAHTVTSSVDVVLKSKDRRLRRRHLRSELEPPLDKKPCHEVRVVSTSRAEEERRQGREKEIIREVEERRRRPGGEERNVWEEEKQRERRSNKEKKRGGEREEEETIGRKTDIQSFPPQRAANPCQDRGSNEVKH